MSAAVGAVLCKDICAQKATQEAAQSISGYADMCALQLPTAPAILPRTSTATACAANESRAAGDVMQSCLHDTLQPPPGLPMKRDVPSLVVWRRRWALRLAATVNAATVNALMHACSCLRQQMTGARPASPGAAGGGQTQLLARSWSCIDAACKRLEGSTPCHATCSVFKAAFRKQTCWRCRCRP